MKLNRFFIFFFLAFFLITGTSFSADNKAIQSFFKNDSSKEQVSAFPDKHGDTLESATSVEPDSQTSGNINSTGDKDFFTFTVLKDGEVKVYSEGRTPTNGALLSGPGVVMVSGKPPAGKTGFFIESSIRPGTFFVRVTPAGEDIGPYQLFIKFIPREEDHEQEEPETEGIPAPKPPQQQEEESVHEIPEGWYKWHVKETGNTCGFPAVKLTGFVKLTYLEDDDKVRMDFSNGTTYFAEAMDPKPEEPGEEVDPAINVILGMEKTSLHEGSVVIEELWEITLYDKDGGIGVGFSTTKIKSPDINCKITHSIHMTLLEEIAVKENKLDEKLEKADKNKKK